MSNRICAETYLPIQKREKMCCEQFVGRPLAGDFFECRPGLLQVGEQEFLRRRLLLGSGPSRSNQAGLRALDQRDVSHVRQAGPVGEQIDVQRPEDPLSELSSPSPIGAATRMASSRCHAAGKSALLATRSSLFIFASPNISSGLSDQRTGLIRDEKGQVCCLRGLPRARNPF